MKKALENQNGYSLILVLLIIAVIGFTVATITSNIMNSNAQFQKAEEKQQLADLTEMGKLYIENAVAVSTQNAKNNVMTWLQSSPSPSPDNNQITTQYFNELNTAMNTFFTQNEKIIVLKNNSIQYKMDIVIDSNGKKVEYTVTPSLNGTYINDNSINGEISINLNLVNN